MFRTGLFQAVTVIGEPRLIFGNVTTVDAVTVQSEVSQELKERGLTTCPEDIELHTVRILMRLQLSVLHCGKHNEAEFRKLLTVGLTRVQCRLHSIIIHLKIKKYLISSSLQSSLSAKLLTRQEDGSIHFLQYQHLLFDKAPYKNVIVLGHVLDKDGQEDE